MGGTVGYGAVNLDYDAQASASSRWVTGLLMSAGLMILASFAFVFLDGFGAHVAGYLLGLIAVIALIMTRFRRRREEAQGSSGSSESQFVALVLPVLNFAGIVLTAVHALLGARRGV